MLNKYHRQKVQKKNIKELIELKRKYKLPQDIKDDFDLLKLSIFQRGLKQKEIIENTFETVRRECFDMWDYLSFYERNDLILKDLNVKLDTMKSFYYEDTRIVIPFLDRLLNSLYTTETAILELPQFLNMYENFMAVIEDVEIYGLLPYISGFSYVEDVFTNNEAVVLFDKDNFIFYYMTNNIKKRYPILKTKDKIIENDILNYLGYCLLEDENKFIDALIKNKLVHKRFMKKYERNLKDESK